MDQEVEDVLLGVTRAEDIKGAVRSSEVRPGRAMRWFGRGLRRPLRDRLGRTFVDVRTSRPEAAHGLQRLPGVISFPSFTLDASQASPAGVRAISKSVKRHSVMQCCALAPWMKVAGGRWKADREKV